MKLTRRGLLGTGVLLGGAGGGGARGAAPRLAVLDYGLTETVLALGAVPLGLPDPADYRLWVVDPPLPPGALDLGSRTQPNLELLASLEPDAILCIQDHDPILPQLRRIAPVLRLPIYTPDRDPWQHSVQATRAIGALLHREAAAEALVEDATRRLAEARLRLSVPGRPVLLASFADPRHLLVYGTGSILQAVLDRLGLRNAWTGPTGIWGSATVGLDALAPFADAVLFTFDPQPPDLAAALAASPLWQALPFGRTGRAHRLPPVLMFGTLPAAMRFAGLLVPLLERVAHG